MERTYYGKEGSSSLSMRRRNLSGAPVSRSEQRFYCDARRGFIGATSNSFVQSLEFFCDFHRLWLGDRPQCEYQLANQRCLSRTNGTQFILSSLFPQPCECV